MPDPLPNQTDIELHMPYIAKLARDCNRIVEIGVGHGNGSTRAIASVQPAIHIMVDHFVAQPIEIPDGAIFVKGDSRSMKTVFYVSRCMAFAAPDLIFIDTHHTYEQLEQELRVWSIIAWSGTKWLFHDTYMNGEPNPMCAAIVEYCADHKNMQYREISRESHGLWIMESR